MTKSHDEDWLREEFRRLRADTERPGAVPDFAVMMAEAKDAAAAGPELTVVKGTAPGIHSVPRRRRAVAIGGWASALAAAAVAGVLLIGGPSSDAEAEFERLVSAYSSDLASAWASPTSGLLDVPGMNLTRSVPSLGGPVRGVDPRTLPNASESGGRDS